PQTCNVPDGMTRPLFQRVTPGLRAGPDFSMSATFVMQGQWEIIYQEPGSLMIASSVDSLETYSHSSVIQFRTSARGTIFCRPFPLSPRALIGFLLDEVLHVLV